MIELAIGNRKCKVAGNIRVESSPDGRARFFLGARKVSRSLCFIEYTFFQIDFVRYFLFSVFSAMALCPKTVLKSFHGVSRLAVRNTSSAPKVGIFIY